MSETFLTQINLDVEWSRFQQNLLKTVEERMNAKILKMEQKLELYATEESISERLKKKSSIYDFGAQAK